MKLNIKLLKRLCLINRGSQHEYPMVNFILNYCYKIPHLTFELDHYGNLFITKNTTNPEYYPCIIAHMDEVFDYHVSRTLTLREGILRAKFANGKPAGLTADDANGILIALQLLETLSDLKVVFTTEEEIGAIGAEEATLNLDFLDNVSYFVQADRRGSSDLITHTNCIDSASDEWVEIITPLMEKYKYSENTGTFTDVGVFAETLEISGVNVSCGYYKEHSENEHTVIKELENCLNFIYEILTSVPLNKTYNIKVTKYNYYSYYPAVSEFNKQSKLNNKHDFKSYDLTSCYDYYDHPIEYDDKEVKSCETCRDFDCMNCRIYNSF